MGWDAICWAIGLFLQGISWVTTNKTRAAAQANGLNQPPNKRKTFGKQLCFLRPFVSIVKEGGIGLMKVLHSNNATESLLASWSLLGIVQGAAGTIYKALNSVDSA